MLNCDSTFLPIGIRHGNDSDDLEAALAARCRCDSDAKSSTASATAVHVSDVTSMTDDVMPTPFPATSAFRLHRRRRRRSTSGTRRSAPLCRQLGN